MSSTVGITWYDAPTAGFVVDEPTLSAVGEETYYAEYSEDDCTSLTRTPVTLTINAAPAPIAPLNTGTITVCETSQGQTLDANDALDWSF